MHEWHLDFIVKDVGEHKGEEAEQEAHEDGQHHSRQSRVLSLSLCRLCSSPRILPGGALRRILWLLRVRLQPQPLSSHRVVDARIGNDDNQARQEDSEEEEHLLRRSSLFIPQNSAGESLLVQAQATIQAEQGHHLKDREAY